MCHGAPMSAADDRADWQLVIHGGAGVIERGRIAAEEEAGDPRRAGPGARRRRGDPRRGGSALDAVEAAVRVLEDDPHFNAGRGSVFTYEGRIEMDASIMDGRDRNAGAVTGVTATRNPIGLARAVMEQSPHVFLSREGADQFSREQGLRAGAARLFRDRRAPPPARGIARPARGRAFRRRI